MARDTVKIDLAPLRRFDRALRNDGPHIKAGLRQWKTRYLGFSRRRYLRFSRGGGSWKPLAKSTVQKRRKGGKQRGGVDTPSVNTRRTGGNAAILRNTGTLLGTLDVGRPDNFKFIKHGVRVGFLPRTPAKRRGGKRSHLSIAKLAAIHHFGRGNVPARRLLDKPDRQTLRGMIGDMRRAIQRTGRAARR